MMNTDVTLKQNNYTYAPIPFVSYNIIFLKFGGKIKHRTLGCSISTHKVDPTKTTIPPPCSAHGCCSRCSPLAS
jgi:hypothetical protein